MVEIKTWTQKFLLALDQTFGNRVWFAGLQGSYARGEATESSDIDMAVILDVLTPADVDAYHKMLEALPHRELLCGFLSGKEELLHWDPADLFQFYYDTMPIKGNLEALRPLIDGDTVDRAIKMGACNLYHSCVHNMLYGKSEDALRELYKAASFVVQAVCFRETGKYIRHQKELLQWVGADEKTIVETFMALKKGDKVQFEEMSHLLFAWSKKWITKTR